MRIIPIALRRLVARLLLLDADAVSTEELTKSFGWSNEDTGQQHDIQVIVLLQIFLAACIKHDTCHMIFMASSANVNHRYTTDIFRN